MSALGHSRTNRPGSKSVEMSSWQAIIGRAAPRMGIAVLPRIVLTTFSQKDFLSAHPFPPELNHAPTVLIWRKGARSPKISALIEVLGSKAKYPPRRKKA
jgi:DNA-binding transcriptional LysR family regulator